VVFEGDTARITIPARLMKEVDGMVTAAHFRNRTEVVQFAALLLYGILQWLIDNFGTRLRISDGGIKGKMVWIQYDPKSKKMIFPPNDRIKEQIIAAPSDELKRILLAACQ